MKLIMENFRKFIVESYEVPPVLYHASYGPLMSSIQKDGLGGDRDTYWEDSMRGVVYLALDPQVAFSYAETSDDAWDKFETEAGLEIIIMKVDTTQLNPELFKIDSNVMNNQGDTVEYHGIVPPTAIEIVDKRVA